jgi:hypothetical protein
MHASPHRSSASLSASLDRESSKGGLTLLITGPSPELQQKLVTISDLRPTLILSSDTLRDSDTLPASTLDLIADAILHRDARAIVVCGHTSDTAARPPLHLLARQADTRSVSQMLQRMRDRMERQKRAQDRLRFQLDQIRADARIARATKSHKISLCGLFHVAESDVFLVYDPAEDQFVPLVEATLWHPEAKGEPDSRHIAQ